MPRVTILTSAVGLGTYIPALLVCRQLRHYGVDADVEVLEHYYLPGFQQRHVAVAEAHHASFALAQMAHRMARTVRDYLDGERVQRCLLGWAEADCRHFIVWSGFWLPIVERYRTLTGWTIQVDHCRIDAEISASFKVHADLDSLGREIWLWQGDTSQLVYEIPVDRRAPKSFLEREPRLMIHGGGWGIGTYRERARELSNAGFDFDLVVHNVLEGSGLRDGDNAYRLKPGWRAWVRNDAGEFQFPPMDRVAGYGATLGVDADYHGLYDLIRNSQAIISKPGGGSLIDSLASGTPIILLEPYGYAEARNSEIWQKLGFGIRYEDWRETGFSRNVLERLHRNLIEHTARGIDYPRAYADQLLLTT